MVVPYFEASRGRTEIVPERIRRGSGPVQVRLFTPKGTVHAVSADATYVTVCGLDTLPLRTFPAYDFARVDREPGDRCTTCLNGVRG